MTNHCQCQEREHEMTSTGYCETRKPVSEYATAHDPIHGIRLCAWCRGDCWAAYFSTFMPSTPATDPSNLMTAEAAPEDSGSGAAPASHRINESPSYRQSMRDAGRSDLVGW